MSAVEAYLIERGIPAELPPALGVELRDSALVYPNGRVRNLNGDGPPMVHPAGTTLSLWWPNGCDLGESRAVILTEGESDAMAAVAASAPCPVGAVPGAGFPPQKLAKELRENGVRVAYLAGDGDEAGRKFMRSASEALWQVGIRPIPIELPDDLDLASHLAVYMSPDEELRELLLAAEAAGRRGHEGSTVLLDEEVSVEILWGNENAGLWAAGEPLYFVSPPNVGKTTLAQQLALRRAGIRHDPLLDLPCQRDKRLVLYLALDRPRQAVRSWRRMVEEEDRGRLNRLVIWRHGLPFTISSEPGRLLPWVRRFGSVGTVFIDSLFNAAPRLSDEEGGANANNALQSLVRAGIEVVVLHHDRKADQKGRSTPRLDDVFGARPITAGAGSVLYLDADEPGKLNGTLRQLKAPAGRMFPIDYAISPVSGRVFKE